MLNNENKVLENTTNALFLSSNLIDIAVDLRQHISGMIFDAGDLLSIYRGCYSPIIKDAFVHDQDYDGWYDKGKPKIPQQREFFK